MDRKPVSMVEDPKFNGEETFLENRKINSLIK
jgi:hypothetical protein